MTLNDFLAAENGRLSRLAKACGVSPGRISQLRSGGTCSPTLALNIERFSGGAVDAASLSNDVRVVRASTPPDAPTAEPAGQDQPQRIITCAVCDRRLDSAAAAQCELVDCPRAEREAA